MKKIVFLFLLSSIFVISQTNIGSDFFLLKNKLPKNIKKITQFENGNLINILEYDSLQNLIFSYSKEFVHERFNHQYLIVIKCNIYDKNSKLIKWYYLHSNVGFSIYSNELDSNGNIIKQYKNESENIINNSLINTNSFYSISEIKNREFLLNNESVKNFEIKSSRFLINENDYDQNNNLISTKTLNKNHHLNNSSSFKYDEQNRLLSEEHNSSDGFNYRFNYNYRDSLNCKIKLIERKSTEDSVEESEVYTDIYKYNEHENLVEKIELKNYQNYLKHVFNYNNSNIVEIKEYDFYDGKQNLRYITKNFYNKNGFLSKSIIEYFPYKEIEKRKYNYKLEFYNK